MTARAPRPPQPPATRQQLPRATDLASPRLTSLPGSLESLVEVTSAPEVTPLFKSGEVTSGHLKRKSSKAPAMRYFATVRTRPVMGGWTVPSQHRRPAHNPTFADSVATGTPPSTRGTSPSKPQPLLETTPAVLAANAQQAQPAEAKSAWFYLLASKKEKRAANKQQPSPVHPFRPKPATQQLGRNRTPRPTVNRQSSPLTGACVDPGRRAGHPPGR